MIILRSAKEEGAQSHAAFLYTSSNTANNNASSTTNIDDGVHDNLQGVDPCLTDEARLELSQHDETKRHHG